MCFGIVSKYTCFIRLKDKKGITITNAFQKIFKEPNRKPNKIWVDKGYIDNVCIDKLGDIVNKYNNTYHKTIKMKPADVKSNTYINSSKGINDKDPKFRIGDIVKISKYKNIFSKDYAPDWSEEVFVIIKVKNTVPLTYLISDLHGEEIVGTF